MKFEVVAEITSECLTFLHQFLKGWYQIVKSKIVRKEITTGFKEQFWGQLADSNTQNGVTLVVDYMVGLVVSGVLLPS